MSVKQKLKTQIFLVIAISFLLSLLLAYVNYYVLTEADFLSPYSKLENTDLDCLLLLRKQKLAAWISVSYKFSVIGDLIGFPSSFYFPMAFPQVKTLILRC